MNINKIKKLTKLIIGFISAMTINPHDLPLGYEKYKRLSIGDLVKWTELSDNWKDKSQKIGIIAELYVEHRGRREVAIAKIHEITNSRTNLALLGKPKEVLVMNLEILSKVATKDDEISI